MNKTTLSKIPTQPEIRLLILERECLIDFMRAVAREVNCLPSYADPRPNGGNSHIIESIRKLKKRAES